MASGSATGWRRQSDPRGKPRAGPPRCLERSEAESGLSGLRWPRQTGTRELHPAPAADHRGCARTTSCRQKNRAILWDSESSNGVERYSQTPLQRAGQHHVARSSLEKLPSESLVESRTLLWAVADAV